MKRLSPRAGCTSQLDALQDCVDEAADPDTECGPEIDALEACSVVYCDNNANDADCQVLNQ